MSFHFLSSRSPISGHQRFPTSSTLPIECDDFTSSHLHGSISTHTERGNTYYPRDHVRPEAFLERKDRTLGGLSFEINSRSPSPNIHRPAKRRRTSVINLIGSSSDIDNQMDPESDTIIVEVPQLNPTPESKPAPQPGNNNITTRPRRKAALKSRYATIAQAKSVDRPLLQRSNRLTINQKTANGIQAKLENDGKGKGKGKEKEKPSTKTKNLNKDNGQDRGKKESTKNTDEDEDDNYECPCGYGCSTISFCESRKKEITTRDVGMSVIISYKTSIAVLVGTPSHQETFVVHKDLLALHSDYFASLFRQTQDVTPPSSTSIIQAKSASFDRNELSLDAPLQPRFFGAIKGNNLVMGIESTGSVARVEVKQGEDSDEDIEIISSDQYYATLPSKSNSLKLKLTPIKHRSILPGKATLSHPTLISFASTASASKTYPIPFQEKSIFELPTTILPLQFSLFISYIYIGSMAPTLLLATDDKDSCTWEALHHVGYTLRSAGFMNYCMEGLRELRSVRKGIWPSPTEAKLVWKMDLEMGGLNMAILDIAGLNNESSLGVGNADSDTRSSSDSDILSLDGKMSPLHEFVVACIAYNSPMSSDQANTPNYRAWKRLLSSKETSLASLSIMVHAMNRKMFMGKEPWNDEFRGLWEIVEEDVSTRWREILEKRKGQSEGVRKETRDGIKSVQELLERMALRGESGLTRIRRANTYIEEKTPKKYSQKLKLH